MELSTLYHNFHRVLLNFIKSKISNEQDAEDILHDVFIKIVNNIDRVSDKEKLKSWIYSITRNAIIDYYRSNVKYKTTTIDDTFNNLFTDEEYIDTSKGLECCLTNFIQQLPDDYRNIIIDVELNNIKQKDLTDKYNLAYSSVRSKVQRGREKLKKLLVDCCDIKWDSRGNIIEVDSRSTCHANNSTSCKN